MLSAGNYGRGPNPPVGPGGNQPTIISDYPGLPAEYGQPYRYDAPDAPSFEFAHYWRLLLKHKWLITGVTAACLVLAMVVTLLMVPTFRAETTVQIDREAAKILNVESIEPTEQGLSGEEFFQTQYGLLRSRSLATRVVDDLGLHSPAMLERMGFNVAEGKDGAPLSLTERRKLAVDAFRDSLVVTPVRGSRLVQIAFSSPDPQLAAQVANATAEGFIASNLARRFDSSAAARKFLEERLAITKSRLEDSERKVTAYASQEGIINLPSGSESNSSAAQSSLATSSLIAFNTSLSQAKAERIRAEQRYNQSRSGAAMSLPEVLQSPTIQTLSQDRARLNAQYRLKGETLLETHPEMQALKAQLTELDRQINAEMSNIRQSLRVQYEVARSQEAAFQSQVQGSKSDVLDLRNRTIQYDILQREVDTNRTLYEGLLQRYKEIGVAGGISSNNVSIVDRADVPEKPASPRPLLNLALALVAGLGLGVMGALLLELTDETVGTPDDIENKLGLPFLGSTPKLEQGQTPLGALDDLRSAFSEAYYSIRTAIQFSTGQGAPRTLLVTSARPSEGKSTTAMAIAKNFARLDKSVLLVDGDLRNPSLHRNLSLPNTVGLSNYLVGAAPLASVTQPTGLDNLTFISSGGLPPNPAEILAGGHLAGFLTDALQNYDMVVIDGPPVLGLADAPLLAASMAGTVFVVEAGGTRRGVAKTAIQRLMAGRAVIIGAVLTKFNAKKASYGAGYAYSYDYEYGAKNRLSGQS